MADDKKDESMGGGKDASTLFSGLTGWMKQLVSAGIFGMLAWYTFVAAPKERQLSMEHGEEAIKSINEAHSVVVKELSGKIDKAFDRLIDKQSTLHQEDQKLQKTNLDIQKKILTATKEGGAPQ